MSRSPPPFPSQKMFESQEMVELRFSLSSKTPSDLTLPGREFLNLIHMMTVMFMVLSIRVRCRTLQIPDQTHSMLKAIIPQSSLNAHSYQEQRVVSISGAQGLSLKGAMIPCGCQVPKYYTQSQHISICNHANAQIIKLEHFFKKGKSQNGARYHTSYGRHV